MSNNISEHGYIGPYRLISMVNTGQTSRLWQAFNDHDREFVAVKTLLSKYSKDTQQVAMLQWEYNVAASFRHPRLVHIKKFAWDGSVPYLVLEWFFTPNLKQWINRGYMTYAEHLPEILLMMAEGLMYMHEQGWVHRDIKPDNYLFAPTTPESSVLGSSKSSGGESGNDGVATATSQTTSQDGPQVKLIDFALSKKTVSGFAKLFAMKAKTQGTASYMAPEQILGKPPEPSVDIYSLGCSFFEILTGKLPFAAGSVNELLEKHISAQIPSVIARNKNVTEEMSEVLRMMLAKTPAARYKDAKELYVALKNIRILKRKPAENDVF